MVVVVPEDFPRSEKWSQYAFLNGTETIAGCLDYHLQRMVPVGVDYQTENCEICLCSSIQRMCKQVSCAPPAECSGYYAKDTEHCCDICVPVVEEHPFVHGQNLNLKLGVVTVTIFLLFSLLMFGLHRLRKKRLLGSLTNFHALGRSSAASVENGGGRCGVYSLEEPHPYNGSSSITLPSAGADGHICLNGYAFPEAPPAYTEDASDGICQEGISISPRIGNGDLSAREALGVPPPPYNPNYGAMSVVDGSLRPEGPNLSICSSLSASQDSLSSENSYSSGCSSCSCSDCCSENRPQTVTVEDPNGPQSSGRAGPRNGFGDDRGTAVVVERRQSKKKRLKKLLFHSKKCKRRSNNSAGPGPQRSGAETDGGASHTRV